MCALHTKQGAPRAWCSCAVTGKGAREKDTTPQMEKARQAAMRRALRRLALVCLWGTSFSAGQAGGKALSEATHRKAVALARVLSFVQWPENQAGDGEGMFRLCVDGDSWLAYALAAETRTSTVSGRKIEVKFVQKEQELKSCQMLFVSHTKEQRYTWILEEMKGTSALTVGETTGFVSAGGIVEFVFDQSPLKFEINLAAARTAGLKLDARLLAMAKRVVTKKELPSS